MNLYNKKKNIHNKMKIQKTIKNCQKQATYSRNQKDMNHEDQGETLFYERELI